MKRILLALLVVAGFMAGNSNYASAANNTSTPARAVTALVRPFYHPVPLTARGVCDPVTGRNQACPVTSRLRYRLDHPVPFHDTANLVSRAQDPPSDVRVSVLDNNSRVARVNARWIYGSHRELSYTITFVVRRQQSRWLVDDTYCAGRPATSVYKSPIPPCGA